MSTRPRSRAPSRRIALGPVAFQEAIKLLGTNGGGFFNANSAHPFENPTALSNVVETWSEIVIPFALAVTFGVIVRDRKQGFALFWTMAILMVAFVVCCYAAEAGGNPLLTALGIDPSMGNMEGKEVRFGTAMSSLFAVTTTATSDGAVIAMHDSFTPLGGMIPMFLMQLGEVVPGGVGSGLYGIIVFALLAVFVAGLMVGRTPEYLGKKVQAREIKLAMLAVLILPLCILGGTAICLVLESGTSSLSNAGPHGLSEMLYAFTSATANNGSAFAGLNRGHAVAGLRVGRVHAAGAVRVHDPGAGDRRVAGGQAETAGECGHVPDARAAIRRLADRRDPHSRRPAIPARAIARSVGGAFLDARRQDLLGK